MHIALLILLVVAIVFGPQLWARAVLTRYSRQQDHYPGTGGQFARHLLKKYQIDGVGVEQTALGDHYDPEARCVRLSDANFNGKSLTAVTVAAHEVGHAIQHCNGDRKLAMRTRLVRIAQVAEKAGSVAMFTIPVVVGLSRAPSAGLLMFIVGLLSLGASALVHLITLPVEWDASFGKAMPLIRKGGYLSKSEERAAEKILRACALTYFAASLASLLNIWRWVRFLRR